MLSCTFLPLNTSWIVAALAMEKFSITGELWTTVLLVAVTGAIASTVANLNDYHTFTLLLRSKWIARVRHTRTYQVAARWFERAPFAITFIFNLLPIPVLDGGHIFIIALEGIIRRDLSMALKEKFMQLGFFALITLMVVVLSFDMLKNIPFLRDTFL